jgi:transketolase
MNTELSTLARGIRKSIIEESYRAGMGHIGSSLSIADILAVLFGEVLQLDRGDDRDRLILSKGHAALALYAALAATGQISADELATFCSDGTRLGAHPDHVVPGIDFSTGSLGLGVSLGVGAALGARMRGSERRSIVLISDAELNEGSVWEAAMFAAHHRLGRLIVILDLNGQQGLGYTRDVLNLEPVGGLWNQLGWKVDEVDGHDLGQLNDCLANQGDVDAPPHLVVAKTIFGRGVSYMASRIEWHYLPLSDEDFARAMEELDPELTDSEGIHT